jgi:3',5'-cyclic AMP phosphodiesterase CpdA
MGRGRIALAAAAVLLACCPAAAADPVVVAAGDIACDPTAEDFNGGRGVFGPGHGTCHHRRTARLVRRLRADRVIMLGDAQYRDGLYPKFLVSYGAPGSWGDFLSITRPVPGNHDYGLHRKRFDAEARGYYTYFGGVLSPYGPVASDPTRGWYSFDLRVRNRRTGRAARWHVVALNTMCAGLLAEVIAWRGDCAGDSEQVRWLRRDLKANATSCTLAFFHIPLFASGFPEGRVRAVRPFWRVLYRRGVDVVLNGNMHFYERFAPQTPVGKRSPRGVRQFTVGTGGQTLHPPPRRRARHSEAIAARTHGVLQLGLHGPTRRRPLGWYRWRYHPDARTPTPPDAGTASCVAPRRVSGRRAAAAAAP